MSAGLPPERSVETPSVAARGVDAPGVAAPASYDRGNTSTSNDRAAHSYLLGRLPFSLSGEGECVSYLHGELESLRADDTAHAPDSAHFVPRVAFDFVHALPRLSGYTATAPVYAMPDSFRVHYNSLRYHVSCLEGGEGGEGGAGGTSGTTRASGASDTTRASGASDTTRASGARVLSSAAKSASEVAARSATASSAHGGRSLNPEPCLLNPSPVPPLRLRIKPDDPGRRHRWFSTLYRARDWNFLSSEETHAKNFMYGVFDYVTQLAQLELGQSYIHASSLVRDGEGTAIVAWGGIGKTSAALKLITEHGFQFLSDDLGLVDDAGTIWRTPKRLQVYAYNLEGEERLRSMLLDGRSALDRAAWEWKLQRRGPKGVRRRVSAEELFGRESVARSAPLKRVFCLERGDASDFEAREITTEELAHRAAEVVMHEIEPFGLLSRALHSGHHAPLLPTQDEVVAATRSVLRRAFDGLPVVSVRVPLSTTPTTLANYLLSLIEK